MVCELLVAAARQASATLTQQRRQTLAGRHAGVLSTQNEGTLFALNNLTCWTSGQEFTCILDWHLAKTSWAKCWPMSITTTVLASWNDMLLKQTVASDKLGQNGYYLGTNNSKFPFKICSDILRAHHLELERAEMDRVEREHTSKQRVFTFHILSYHHPCSWHCGPEALLLPKSVSMNHSTHRCTCLQRPSQCKCYPPSQHQRHSSESTTP